MSVTMDDSIKGGRQSGRRRWWLKSFRARRRWQQGSRAHDLSPSEIEGWVDDAKRGMETALRVNPLEIREHYQKQLKDCRKPSARPCWSCAPEESCRPSWSGRTALDPDAP